MINAKTKLQQAKEVVTKRKPVFWNICDLDRSYHFFIGRVEDPECELFIEYDELLGENPAFENAFPLSMMDVIERLDNECAETVGLQTADGSIVILKKNTSSPGILLSINGQVKDFFSNRALSTINFLDFYGDIKDDAEIDIEETEPTEPIIEEVDNEKGIAPYTEQRGSTPDPDPGFHN